MQPYFLPYIGYFQLIAAVDLFVIYDNIKYTKKGWINRNRMLVNGRDAMFSLPLKSGSDTLDIRNRELAVDFNREKLLNQIRGAYQRAPRFTECFPLVEEIINYSDTNLFNYIHNSVAKTCLYLNIGTEVRISGSINIDHCLKAQEKVIALCKAVGATTYINAIGGTDLYSVAEFEKNALELRFVKPRPFAYDQFGGEFVPWLSIIDVMMFNSVEQIQYCVANGYDLI